MHGTDAVDTTCNGCPTTSPPPPPPPPPSSAVIPVTNDWPSFPSTVAWLEGVCGCELDVSDVVTTTPSLSLEEGDVHPAVMCSADGDVVLGVGDTVRTKPYSAQLLHQRCGWARSMAVFCGREGTIERLQVNEDRAQVLLAFVGCEIDPAYTVNGRRDVCWFDYESLDCRAGTRLPTPPGGWYERLLRFPFAVGDSVRVQPYCDAMRAMRCGWDTSARDTAGQVGTIVCVFITAAAAQVQLSFSTTSGWRQVWWDLEYLEIPAYRVKQAHTTMTGFCKGTVTIKASSVRSCPRHHSCEWVRNPYSSRGCATVECEGCGHSVTDRAVLHCDTCDFDLCEDCAADTKVISRATDALTAMSCLIRVGDIPEPWLPPLTKALEKNAYGHVALRRIVLEDGRDAVHLCTTGDVRYIAAVLEGVMLCSIHGSEETAAGTPLVNQVGSVDASILAAIERSFRCTVVLPPCDVDSGTVMLLCPSTERAGAAGKLVWYCSARRVVLRIDPSERGVVQRKVSEIREHAKCHVSLEHGTLVKLFGLPNAVRATRSAIDVLLKAHRAATQRDRVDKAMAGVVSSLCEVRVSVPISAALQAVLSQLHEPAPQNATTAAVPPKRAQPDNIPHLRQQIHAELTQLQQTGTTELLRVGALRKPLQLPGNVAGMRAFLLGERVVRGHDWAWDDQDGGVGQIGRVFDFPVRHEMTEGGLVDGWVSVEWANRSRFNYRVGSQQDVVHATHEGEQTHDEGNYSEELPQRLTQHRQAHIYLANAVGTLRVQHQQLLLDVDQGHSVSQGTRRDALQQRLHQATRDKARLEHSVQGCLASLSRETERTRQTLGRVEVDLGSGVDVAPVREASPPLSGLQLQGTADMLTQHLESLRGLRTQLQRHSGAVCSRLAEHATELRRVLGEEIRRQRFSGWDIILRVMQETNALIQYHAGDNKLVLTGGESAVSDAKAQLRSYTVKDLYALSRLHATVPVTPAQHTQLTHLQRLLCRIIVETTGVESALPEQHNDTHHLRLEGTRAQIERAVHLLSSRLACTPPLGSADIIWEQAEMEASSLTASLVCTETDEVALGSLCAACTDPLTSENTLQLLCGHRAMCASCLRQWVATNLSERRPATCTDPECKRMLTAGEYRALMQHNDPTADPAVCNDYEHILAREKLRQHTVSCTQCDGFAVRDEAGCLAPIACADCGSMLCARPGCGDAHFFLDCDEVASARKAMLLRRRARSTDVADINLKLQQLEEASLTQGVLQSEMRGDGATRPCPACGALVHKDGGCDSMRCSCGQQFCHLCLSTTCTLVEASGVKTPCQPERLSERIHTALASHRGTVVFERWTHCDVCDCYPVALEKRLFACTTCLNWYVCESCESAGLADTAHPSTHLLVEIDKAPETQFVCTDPPPPGPDYELDWSAIKAGCGTLKTQASFGTASPRRGTLSDVEVEESVSILIEPITPLDTALQVSDAVRFEFAHVEQQL